MAQMQIPKLVEKMDQIAICGKEIHLYLFRGVGMERGTYNRGAVFAQIDLRNYNFVTVNGVAIKNNIGFVELEDYGEIFIVFFEAEIEDLYNLDRWNESIRFHRANRAYLEAKDKLKEAIKMLYDE